LGAQDFLPLLGTDYVEFYVGNAKQSAIIIKQLLVPVTSLCGLETGVKDRTSYVLGQQGAYRSYYAFNSRLSYT
jgi:4-hydroxyphenylpyruvate dioxygenase